jgi:alpha-tubulin suppressor-like RCC1 family protein/N-acetylmuramoyl-L-alanine amidase
VDVTGLTSGVAAVAAGGRHTCALTTAGGLKCWGYNSYGQLGDGTTTGHSTPADVTGLTSGVAAVAAGGWHTCALTTAGGLKCWGDDSWDQLGDGTNSDRWTPADVAGLTSGVAAVAAGWEHACALTTTGGLKCWGDNQHGQLGDGTTSSRSTPVDVSGLTSGVAAVAAGGEHTCALTTAGGLKCWGYNNGGSTPVDVSGLTSGVAAVAAGGEHTCALTTAGGLKCWGYNSYGQLGDGTTTGRSTPADVTGLTSGVTAVAAGGRHTCALTTAGGLKCWGFNGERQLGDGTTTDRWTPVNVTGLTSGVAAVAAGAAHTCALTTTGGLKCWGSNGEGQLGDGTTTSHGAPVDVTGLTSGVAAVAAGWSHTCALTSAGGLKCWGDNDRGQLGYGALWIPVDVVGFATPNSQPLRPAALSQSWTEGAMVMVLASTTGESTADVEPLPLEGTIGDSTVVLKARLFDPEGDMVRLEVELRRVDEDEGKFKNVSTSPSSGLVSSDSEASVAVYGLISGCYHWQARAVDENGKEGPWVSFGDNDPPDGLPRADFRVVVEAEPLRGRAIAVNPGHGLREKDTTWGFAQEAYNLEGGVTDPQGKLKVIYNVCYPADPPCRELPQANAYVEDLATSEIAEGLAGRLSADSAEVLTPRQLDQSACCHLPTGRPWWELAGRYYLENLGLSETVKCPSSGVNTLVWQCPESGSKATQDLMSRPLFANLHSADIMVGIHSNACEPATDEPTPEDPCQPPGTPPGSNVGTWVLYSAYYNQIDDFKQKASEQLARYLYGGIVSQIRAGGRSAWPLMWTQIKQAPSTDVDDAKAELRFSEMPAAIVEAAFHNNPDDLDALEHPAFEDAVGQGVYMGIRRYFCCAGAKADLGNIADEALHNVSDDWDEAQGPPDNTYTWPDRTKRYQPLRGSASVDLFPKSPSALAKENIIGYDLVVEVEDGICDDSFQVFLNDSNTPVLPLYTADPNKNEVVQHTVRVPNSSILPVTTVKFENLATDDCGRAAVYNVELKPVEKPVVATNPCSKADSVPPGETVQFPCVVELDQRAAAFAAWWKGSTVGMTLVTPDGQVIGPDTTDPNVYHDGSLTHEFYSIIDPQPGEWTVRLFGDDVPAEGEDVTVDVSTVAVVPDGDGDSVADVDDNCPAVANSGQANTDVIVNPPGDELGDACDPDDDNDGFSDVEEQLMGTDELDNCANGPGHDAWPLDINNDREIHVVTDVLNFRGRIGATPADPNWSQRLDFNADGLISVVGDVLKYRGRIGETCT